MTTARASALCLFLCFGLSHEAAAQDDETPRAGDAFTGSVFGRTVEAFPRDRSRVTALCASVQWTPGAPERATLEPQGALYLWRTREDGSLLRAVLLGIFDDVRWIPGTSRRVHPVLTFENTTLPLARADSVAGRRLSGEELRWSFVRAGLGVGVRSRIAPAHPDNAFEASLAYEAGRLFFRRGDDTLPEFREPSDAYEGRLHARLRVDAFERNLVERPHAGFAAGLDATWAHRAGWQDWGGGPSGPHEAADTKSWSLVTGYALVALPVPFVKSSRHRILAAVHAGAGSHLDRFSAPRLSGGSNAGDAETLVQPILPAATIDELAPRGYVIADLEYRWEALFFLYLHVRGTAALVDRLLALPAGGSARRTDSLNAVTVGVTSGFLWSSTLEIFFSHAFDLEARDGDRLSAGRSALYFSYAKGF